MFVFARDKEKDRYYLFAGMGGKARRRKERFILQWSIAAGLFASTLMAWALYWLSHSHGR